MSEFPDEGFEFVYHEGFAVGAPCCAEGANDVLGEIRGRADHHATCVDDVAQYALYGTDDHIFEFVEADGVLASSVL